jgi:hypothetical protein
VMAVVDRGLHPGKPVQAGGGVAGTHHRTLGEFD